MIKSEFKISYDKEVKKVIPCYKIDLPIYKCEVLLLSVSNTKKLNKAWGREGYGAGIRDYLEDHNQVVITFNEYSDENLVHELHHAVDMIMLWIGHKVIGVDEPKAYLMGYLYKESIKKKHLLCK